MCCPHLSIIIPHHSNLLIKTRQRSDQRCGIPQTLQVETLARQAEDVKLPRLHNPKPIAIPRASNVEEHRFFSLHFCAQCWSQIAVSMVVPGRWIKKSATRDTLPFQNKPGQALFSGQLCKGQSIAFGSKVKWNNPPSIFNLVRDLEWIPPTITIWAL